jgi:hypothetical protein
MQVYASMCKYENICNYVALNVCVCLYVFGYTTLKLTQKVFFVHFSTANSLVVDRQKHGPGVDVKLEKGAARARRSSTVAHAHGPGVTRFLASMHVSGNGAGITMEEGATSPGCVRGRKLQQLAVVQT